MASKILSVGLVLTFAGMCLCQQQAAASSPTPYQAAVSQASYQKASSAAQQPQIKLEDIERDSIVAAYGQKSQQQASNPIAATSGSLQQQQQQQSYQVPQQQYFLQPYQGQPQQFYMQPYQDQQQQQQYLAQPYQMAFDYSGVQYMIVNPNAYSPVGNQVYQQYFVPAAQPSPVPQYVTKQSSPAAAQAPQQYKQLAAPAQVQQVYRQQQFVVPTLVPQEYKPQFAVPAQQQYVIPEPIYQYVQQPAAPTATTAAGPGPSPADFSYVTRHPAAPSAQFKAPAAAPVQASAAVQPQFQYTAVPQQYQQQPQYYYTAGQVSAAAAAAAAEQPQRVQQSAKSQYSSGVKSTTPFPVKESFAYKFESSPQQPQQQQQQPSAAYSTLKYSA